MALIAGSGGEAEALLRSDFWKQAPRLERVAATAPALGAFLRAK